MGLFSFSNKKRKFKLSKKDFKTSREDFEVISVKFRDDFLKKFPQVKKKENYSGKQTIITNTTTIDLFRNKVDITYDKNELEITEEQFIEHINQKIEWIANNEKTINFRIANKLVSLKNNNWLDKNESKISKDEFIKRITLKTIFFYGDGNSLLTFDDDKLFLEHQIVASLNRRNKLNNINLSG